jgi:Luciferase-like monooxygenase
MNPFRFGVSVWHAPSRAEWIAKARKIEDLGYSSLLVPDHLNERVAPMPALISAAEATKRIRVCTYVLNNDLRAGVKPARKRNSPGHRSMLAGAIRTRGSRNPTAPQRGGPVEGSNRRQTSREVGRN